jgi:hypothetical protein
MVVLPSRGRRGADLMKSAPGRGQIPRRVLDVVDPTPSIDFWKAGFLNSGSYVFTQILDMPSSLGKTVTYLCSRDNPGQP